MSDRFYLDPAVSTLSETGAEFGGDEAHHFIRVMRGKTGGSVILFDGSGFVYYGTVESITKNSVVVSITEKQKDGIESPLRLTIACPLPKGDRQRFLVEKLAELGVERFIPLALQRSVARTTPSATAKFRRYVIEAAKQCGRNVLMTVEEEMTLPEFIKLLTDDYYRLILHPVSLGEAGQITVKKFLEKELPKHIAVLTGPEGSFTDSEVEAAIQSGFAALDLGARILRTETAAVAAAALLLTYAG
ncbi:ribosomal RNA small subunit methyltransferase E [Planctomycetales bacterium]|nr:ribosomal RNA small subunit methyltransferase E [Planctomycetales bacterium]